MLDKEGNQITYEDWEYENKFINYKNFEWTQENPISFRSKSGDTISSYRQSVPDGMERQGVVFFVHGYGSNTANYAYLGHMFAE